MKQKTEGSAILITMVVGAVMLSLGITSLRLVLSDAKISQDFLLTERAYFAAESGMEKALYQLKQNPIEHIENHELPLSEEIQQAANINIQNLVTNFTIRLNPFESKKFRLKKDLSITEFDPEGIQITSSNNLALRVSTVEGSSNNDQLHWKLICSKDNGVKIETISYQGSRQIIGTDSFNFEDLSGSFDTSTEQITNLGYTQFRDEKMSGNLDSCFVSLTNHSTSSKLQVNISGIGDTGTISPFKSEIKSTGISGDRQKTIVFNYIQKNLGELFDFVFFHTGE